MRVSRRRRRHGVLFGSLVLLIAGASTSVGYQDFAGLLAHRPEVTERARIFVVGSSLTSLKTATFAWPAPQEGPLGAAIPEPPRVPLAVSVNRDAKADRLPLALAARPVDPSPGTNSAGPASVAAGSGTAGIGTDPAEASDAEVAAIEAGDPTGDASEYDDFAQDNGEEPGAGAPAPAGDEAVAMLPGDVVDIGGAPETRTAAATPPAPASAAAPPARPIYHETAFIFGADPTALPPQPFHYLDDGGISVAAKGEVTGEDATPSSPAERLGLEGKRRARAEKCLAEAVYFESRGEPERGQVAVAQVVMNRVFSGYYPADVCRAVYQNANRKLACQFTFACDNIRDVVTEPELWKQATRIAADMLDGKVWDEKVGKATHYHAQSVHPRWVREMRKLDRIGEHTFYRPRRWDS
ncbi:cell wall hydrolase [Starkeya sp. ORNL1]|uniref:cell wall hydrolase n=1 Tax=Starkeya sp. ORNL1 TaxID=2709380 RepID=UPI00146384E9|nr:cell wall hydrolase [Starkeya sp. ORNL1]QJP15245.1 cell wall hydrolase [Starkeya sp. ORNL1]